MITTMTRPDRGRLLSARDAEKVLGIPASTIRTWFQRKSRTNLWDFGTDRRGNPMFREADLVTLRSGRKLPAPRRNGDDGEST